MNAQLLPTPLGVVLSLLAGLTMFAQQPAAPAPQQPPEISARITGEPGTAPRYAVPDFIALSPGAAEIEYVETLASD